MIFPGTEYKWIFLSLLLVSPTLLYAEKNSPAPEQIEQNKFKPPPQRLRHRPEVILEWSETLPDCTEDKVCIEGQLYNNGGKTAYRVHLRINIGGTKYIPPRIFLLKKVDTPIMEPGDRQQFYLEIERKVAYKDKDDKGKIKIMEVGKYNTKILPRWSKTPSSRRK